MVRAVGRFVDNVDNNKRCGALMLTDDGIKNRRECGESVERVWRECGESVEKCGVRCGVRSGQVMTASSTTGLSSAPSSSLASTASSSARPGGS